MDNNGDLLQAKAVLESFLNEMKELESYYHDLIYRDLKEGKSVTELEKVWNRKVSNLYDQYLVEQPSNFYRPLRYPVTYDLSRDDITLLEKEKNKVLIHYTQITGVTEKDRTKQEMIFYLKIVEGKYKIEKLTYLDFFKKKWVKRYI